MPHLHVAEVRKCLNVVRKLWEEHSPETPILLSSELPNRMLISEFCFIFVVGHHTKRHSKSKRASRGVPPHEDAET